jgi:DNA-binding transcriptional regulator PaaX
VAKLLRKQDRLLLILSVIGDTFGNIITGGSNARHFGRLGLYFPPGYKFNNLYHLVYKNIKTGNIEKTIDRHGKVYLQLSSQGQNQYQRKFPLLKLQQQTWDRHWRLVSFDIKEKNKSIRNQLRNKLKQLNFAPMQKSLYISPHDFAQDIIEFLDYHRLLGQALVFEAHHKYLPNPKELTRQLWPVEKINQQYKKLIDKLESSFTLPVNKIQQIIDKYLSLLSQDPHLPYELLPQPWHEPHLRQLISSPTLIKESTIVA